MNLQMQPPNKELSPPFKVFSESPGFNRVDVKQGIDEQEEGFLMLDEKSVAFWTE
jgi:hypothetical protein